MTQEQRDEIFNRLSEPFPPDELRWKPQSVKGNRALAVAYIDARMVMDRLDDVIGVGRWQSTYREAPDGVVCRLRVLLDGDWIEHEDFGALSEQPDGGDRYKASFSDALKRAAVHLGIGRYLYRLPMQWVDYDPQRRQFTQNPRLPDWAMPYGMQRANAHQQARVEQHEQRNGNGNGDHRTVRQKAADFETRLVSEGVCAPGDLMRYLVEMLGQDWEGSTPEELRAICQQFRHEMSQPAG